VNFNQQVSVNRRVFGIGARRLLYNEGERDTANSVKLLEALGFEI
jgi:hypothetical protein